MVSSSPFSASRPATPSVRQLLLSLLLAAFLPALVVMVLLLFLQYQHERRQVVAEMEHHAQHVATRLDDNVANVQAHLARLSEGLRAGAPDLAALREEARIEQRLAQVDAIVLFDTSGVQLMNSRLPAGVSPGPNPPPVDVLASIRMGRPAVSDVFFAPNAQAHMVGIGIPVVDGSHVKYALAAAIESAHLGRMLAPALHGDRSLLIVDRQGRVVAQTGAAPAAAGSALRVEMLGQVTRAAATGRTTVETEDHVMTMQRSAATGWTVIVKVPRSELLEPVWHSALALLLVLMLLLAAGLTVAMRLGRRVTRSIAHLSEGARALREGGTVQIQPLLFREADDFARTFEAASRSLQDHNDTLNRVTQNFDRFLLQEMETWKSAVGRELHDSVGSALGGVSLVLESARGLMPAGIDAGALLPAVEQLAADASNWHGIQCEVLATGSFDAIAPEVANHVYRIIQEAVANAQRHASARNVLVKLVENAQGYEVCISDDGRGTEFPDGAGAHAGVGLRSMRARAEAIEGVINFGRVPEGGCRVNLVWMKPGAHAAGGEDRVEA
ncbi:MAG TPA: ATP-binding protein [Ramlibacter sp.]|uniref:sensor histidine kinase n=1 Tax=Ramlibacter sp. TaxID=1917967 RepID=UPI002ED657CB